MHSALQVQSHIAYSVLRKRGTCFTECGMTGHNRSEDTDAMRMHDFSQFPQQGYFATSLIFPDFSCVYEGKCTLKTHHGCCVHIKKGQGV